MKAVTFGGAMADAIAVIDDQRIERMALKNADSAFLLLEEGHKIEAHEISQHIGGGAINAAVAMARLGFEVAPVVKVGQDARAAMIQQRLQAEDVSTQWVLPDSRLETGASMMVAAHDRNAAIFTYRGANTLLAPEDISSDMFTQADLVYVAGLSNESATCLASIARLAKQAGALLATNPGIRQLLRFGASFREQLTHIDILSINHVEAEALIPLIADYLPPVYVQKSQALDNNQPRLLQHGLQAGGQQVSLYPFFMALKRLGVGTTLITDGQHGAYAAVDNMIYYCPSLSVEVAGTAGAGDAFAATFCAWMANTGQPEAALQAATLNAASVIGFADTQTGLLSKNQLETNLVEQAKHLPVHYFAIS